MNPMTRREARLQGKSLAQRAGIERKHEADLILRRGGFNENGQRAGNGS